MKLAIRHLLWTVFGLALLVSGEAFGQSAQPNATNTTAPAAAAASEAAAEKTATKPAAEQPAKAKKDEKPADPKKAAEKPGKQPEADNGKSDKAEAKKPESKAEPATETVKKSPLKIQVTLRGTFEAQTTREIFVRLKEWKTLEVVKAAPHGARVKKGETLVQFNTDDIERTIADLRADQQIAAIQFKRAEANLRLLEASTPLEMAAAERSKRIADEDLLRFVGVERPLSEKAEDFMLKMYQNSLQYEEEELRQLEKMYKADDLTEETEEIILKRQRDTVERAKFSVEIARILHEQAVKIQLPRAEESRKESMRRQTIELDRTKATLPMALEQQKLELEKLKVQQQRSQQRLQKLLADRDAMKVVAPVDGVVYYGQFVRGDWNGASSAADDLRPGGDVTSGQVFMTIVQPRPLVIRATVSERDLHWMRPGLRGTVEATGYPDLKLSAVLSKIDTVPAIGGKFEALFNIELDKQAEMLVPEMTCTIKLTPYVNKDALTIPASALFTDELDDQEQYVYVLPKDGKPKKQSVTAGKKSGDRVEIVKGLREGDRILREKPKDDEAAK
jgi:HlyD family secretion protein